MIVPGLTGFDAVAELEFPAVDVVVNWRIALPEAAQVVEVVDGVTANKLQVVLVPVHDQTVKLGVHHVGAMTAAEAKRVVC
jgi:hypothetical protein